MTLCVQNDTSLLGGLDMSFGSKMYPCPSFHRETNKVLGCMLSTNYSLSFISPN